MSDSPSHRGGGGGGGGGRGNRAGHHRGGGRGGRGVGGSGGGSGSVRAGPSSGGTGGGGPGSARGGSGGEGRGGSRAAKPGSSSGAGSGGGGTVAALQGGERPKKENILDLNKYMGKGIIVKFSGGREVTGILKGYDALMNLVLDEAKESLRDDEGNRRSRSLGLVVCRGTLLVVISPAEGSEQIVNPFLKQEEDD